jgi:hypothetical protein
VAIVAAMVASDARAASISLASLDQSGPISLTSISETFGPSVATSSTAGTVRPLDQRRLRILNGPERPA